MLWLDSKNRGVPGFVRQSSPEGVKRQRLSIFTPPHGFHDENRLCGMIVGLANKKPRKEISGA